MVTWKKEIKNRKEWNERYSDEMKKNKPYYIKEPFGLPFELTEKDKFRRRK